MTISERPMRESSAGTAMAVGGARSGGGSFVTKRTRTWRDGSAASMASSADDGGWWRREGSEEGFAIASSNGGQAYLARVLECGARLQRRELGKDGLKTIYSPLQETPRDISLFTFQHGLGYSGPSGSFAGCFRSKTKKMQDGMLVRCGGP